MTVTKEQYWKNRETGLRGQGPYPSLVLRYYTPEEWYEINRLKRLKVLQMPDGDF